MIVQELLDYSELNGMITAEHLPDPTMSKCFVLRDNGIIKGYIFVQTIFTVEPLYLTDDVRGGIAVARLFGAACRCLKDHGQTHVFTHSSSPVISDYLTRLGLKPTGYEAFVGEL